MRKFGSLLGSFNLCRVAALLGTDTRLGGAAGTLRIGFRLSRAAEPLGACLGWAVGLFGACARLSRTAEPLKASARLERADELQEAGARLSRAAGPLRASARLGPA